MITMESCRFEVQGRIYLSIMQQAGGDCWQQGCDLSFSLNPIHSLPNGGGQLRGRRAAFASVTVVRQQQFGPPLQQEFRSRCPALEQPQIEPAGVTCCHRPCQSLALLQQQAQRAAEHHMQQTAPGSKPKQQPQHVILQVQQQHSLQEHQQQQQQGSEQQGQHSTPLQACQDGLAGLLAHLSQAKLLVAGAMAAVVSRTAMAPLERVKMDLLLKTSSRSALQTALWVYKREGIAGFWKGNGLNLLRTAPFKVGIGAQGTAATVSAVLSLLT